MKAGPSSARLFSKCAQSTTSRASSANVHAPHAPDAAGREPTDPDTWKRVNFGLARPPSDRQAATGKRASNVVVGHAGGQESLRRSGGFHFSAYSFGFSGLEPPWH